MDEHWESFTIEGEHIGYVHHRTSNLEGERRRTESLTVCKLDEFVIRAHFFYEWENDPLKWVLFGASDGETTVHFERAGDKLTGGDGGTVDLPEEAYPSQVVAPLVKALNFHEGTEKRYRPLIEEEGSVRDEAVLVHAGREEVKWSDGRVYRLHRIEELVDGKIGRIFWADDAKVIIISNWHGPVSYRVESESIAREGMDPGWPTLNTWAP